MRIGPFLLAFGLLLCLLPCRAGALDFNARLSVSPEYHATNRDSPYHRGISLGGYEHLRSRTDLELRLQWEGLTAQSTLRLGTGEKDVSRDAVLDQLYYDGSFGGGLNWSVGKKVLTWGVGFGLRPLDVVQREDRRAVNPPTLEGLPLLALEYFTSADALTLAWSNPLQGRDVDDRDDEALALRYFRFMDDDDLHVVARLSRQRRFEFGAGGTHVVSDGFSLYGAALYGRRYPLTLNRLARDGELFSPSDPLRRTWRRHAAKAVVGAQWTGTSGWGVLAEAYYDGEAYRPRDWQRLADLTKRQLALSALAPDLVATANVAWSSRAYASSNLMRENVLLRLSYDDGDSFKPYVEFLAAPRDRGTIMTTGFEWTRNDQRFLAGIRHYGGAKGSVYREVPEKGVVWLKWEWSL
jgi:hypothetical protein